MGERVRIAVFGGIFIGGLMRGWGLDGYGFVRWMIC
jgi:hypothetical protein